MLPCMSFRPRLFRNAESTRQNVVKILNAHTSEKLREIPPGFNNNILWNAGHLLVSQQLLCYAMSDLPLHVPGFYLPLFRKGTSPKEWREAVDDAIIFDHVHEGLHFGLMNALQKFL